MDRILQEALDVYSGMPAAETLVGILAILGIGIAVKLILEP